MKEALCEAFCEALAVERVPCGFAITTPYTFSDGDPIILYAVTVKAGVFKLEDSGVQIPMLEAAGIGLSGGVRGQGFETLLDEYDLAFDRDAMVVRTGEVTEADIGRAALKLIAFLLRLQDFGSAPAGCATPD